MGTKPLIICTLFAVALGLGVTGCTSEQTSNSTASSTTTPASGVIRDMSVEQFQQLIAQPGTVILDVRTPHEYAAGHIAGAINIDIYPADFAQRIAALDKSKTYAVYCRTDNRSNQALQIMAQQGITKAGHLLGGITAWTQASKPTA